VTSGAGHHPEHETNVMSPPPGGRMRHRGTRCLRHGTPRTTRRRSRPGPGIAMMSVPARSPAVTGARPAWPTGTRSCTARWTTARTSTPGVRQWHLLARFGWRITLVPYAAVLMARLPADGLRPPVPALPDGWVLFPPLAGWPRPLDGKYLGRVCRIPSPGLSNTTSGFSCLDNLYILNHSDLHIYVICRSRALSWAGVLEDQKNDL